MSFLIFESIGISKMSKQEIIRLQPSLQDFYIKSKNIACFLLFLYGICSCVYMYIVFVTSLWDALYNFINELAKPLDWRQRNLKLPWGGEGGGGRGGGGGGVRAPTYPLM